MKLHQVLNNQKTWFHLLNQQYYITYIRVMAPETMRNHYFLHSVYTCDYLLSDLNQIGKKRLDRPRFFVFFLNLL